MKISNHARQAFFALSTLTSGTVDEVLATGITRAKSRSVVRIALNDLTDAGLIRRVNSIAGKSGVWATIPGAVLPPLDFGPPAAPSVVAPARLRPAPLPAIPPGVLSHLGLAAMVADQIVKPYKHRRYA